MHHNLHYYLQIHYLMKSILILLFGFISLNGYSQSKIDYLKGNRYDLEDKQFKFPQSDFKVIGFGAYHGSSKTYDTERILLNAVSKQTPIKYYIPETNFCQAYFFNRFLQTGDTALLKELVLEFQTIVSQEGTIDTYRHWVNLKAVNDSLSDKITVVGLDRINEYKFPTKLILELAENAESIPILIKLRSLIASDTANFSVSEKTYSQKLLKEFAEDYKANRSKYLVSDSFIFNHVLKNVEYTFGKRLDRDSIIVENYLSLNTKYNFNAHALFFKYGFSHLLKARETNHPSFFTRLIESGIYKPGQIITVIGYLTKSQVLWNKEYDNEGKYIGYQTEAGYGIGDYWKEYFKGIKDLKRTRLSDITLYKLNSENSPYKSCTDLMEVKLFMQKSNREQLKGKATASFIDYAVLISNSVAQVPIEEMR